MGLPYWIETFLTLSSPATARNPGRLCSQVGVEYLFPIVPPGLWTRFISTPQMAGATRGLPIYMGIFFKITFGNIVPGVFAMKITAGGGAGYDGTLNGRTLEDGIDTLFFQEPADQLVFYLTNLTDTNQYFQMNSQYLIISSEKDYREFKCQLERLQYPGYLPEPYPQGVE